MSQDDRISCIEFDRGRLEPRLSLEVPGKVSLERGGTEIRMLKR